MNAHQQIQTLIHRQKLLADFGDFALRCEDLDEILTRACQLVGDALGTDLSKVLEIERGAHQALVRAGVGWRPGVVGEAKISLGERSSEAYSIKVSRPVITPDIRQEERFDLPEFLREHGVVALVNVPIFLPGGQAYGLLQVDAREPRDFGEEDVEFLRTYATILGPVIDRLLKTSDLNDALQANNRLMQEMQHRIKNHIAIIAGLVWLRSRAAQSDEARQELQGIGARIDALRLVHEQLYVADTARQLRLRPFVMQLLENLCHLHQEHSGPVRLQIAIADVDLDPDTAVPLGMILTEFASNSLKYAFDGQGGSLAVDIETASEGAWTVRIRDDGKGLPLQAPATRPGSGTGMKLIEGLAAQIRGQAQWSRAGQHGTELRLSFKVKQ
ncbi:sensor histidine kinase [Pseudomonas rhizoryzae]|uniref:sensor histidine kinase n=1 Tax=Pseudomonas rhizoryzae TaxID=2571129 RepID=UPI0007368D5E|nr:histidine kinase dimerization/phosphoacceptor domain -containing protein [Pseudomonas rhizoryzae]KTT22707.1 histidine kinase [Pseudomonas psychrotolerans]KTT36487.1 histidine kinase [Pseudomonas psychrotolerans]KTT78322.1 histidine kinase [Pseudomonas psychrotolerans]